MVADVVGVLVVMVLVMVVRMGRTVLVQVDTTHA
jgi:hypothetical protein